MSRRILFYILLITVVTTLSLLLSNRSSVTNTPAGNIKWPEGKRMALSLSFDDGRASQVDSGTAVLDKYNAKATFFVVPSAIEKHLQGWKKAVANGHEIGNHSTTHPCTGNYSFSRENALENYTSEMMRTQLTDCNKRIMELLGVRAEVFAYPCGQKFTGRGQNVKSYVPLVAELFVAGRGWLDEAPNDPSFCDFAQITGMEMDGKDFEQLLPLIQEATKSGSWLSLAGHEMASSGFQTTRLPMLHKLLSYARDPANGIWIVPIGEVAKYIRLQRKEK